MCIKSSPISGERLRVGELAREWGAWVGYKSFVHKAYAHPTPTPTLKWEGNGCTRKQVDGFRVFTSAIYDAFCRIIASIEAQKGSG